jgi:hypothetical protein
MDVDYLTNLVVVREHEASVIWQRRIILDKHFFLLFASRLVLGPSWVQQSARDRLNATPAICDCLRDSISIENPVAKLRRNHTYDVFR